jgi:glycosyltransferase involved in cell wall biosynthesis
MNTKLTLSFCITCKNRLDQIRKTLPQNLEDNKKNKDLIEFILVDFGSTDGLQEWIQENFTSEIKDSYLKYYYTEELVEWHASVAKNTSHIFARNEILVNLDCDNFTGKDGGLFIIKNMLKYGVNSTVIHQFSNEFMDGSFGRIALSKENFLRIGGYDESFEPMGYQDVNLLIRLMLMGISCIHLVDKKYNKAIVNSKNKGMEYTSQSDWTAMNYRNFRRSTQNITSGHLIANISKKHIGITENIFTF